MVEASRGDVICVNPGEVHDGASIGEAPRAWRMLYIDPVLLEREIGPEAKGRAEIVQPVIYDPLLARRFARLFAALTASTPDLLGSEENLLGCLGHLLRKHGVQRPKVSETSPSVARALERLSSQPGDPVSLGELAALCGVGRFQFLRAFTRATGITPHAYLLQLRVRLAQRLLRDGHAVAEAALGAGFADQSHLTRCFVRQLGVTPGRYRNAVRRAPVSRNFVQDEAAPAMRIFQAGRLARHDSLL
jgi:AraC-like DNA-binding protein